MRRSRSPRCHELQHPVEPVFRQRDSLVRKDAVVVSWVHECDFVLVVPLRGHQGGRSTPVVRFLESGLGPRDPLLRPGENLCLHLLLRGGVVAFRLSLALGGCSVREPWGWLAQSLVSLLVVPGQNVTS